MGKFIVIVLDSFGVGAMDDVPMVRPQDMRANTCKHILEEVQECRLPALRQLGLMNALGEEIGDMNYSDEAVYGVSNLMHYGADTFYGHQELMGTIPKEPLLQPFSEVIDEVFKVIKESGRMVRYIGEQAKALIVDDCVVVGDNLETDLGQVYNVSGCLDVLSFEEIVEIARVVRSVVYVSRVIALGGEGVSTAQLRDALTTKQSSRYVGIDTPKSGLYQQGYRVIHLGYGVDSSVQVPSILAQHDIDVSLIGKVADIVHNPEGSSWPGVDTEYLCQKLLEEVERIEHGFICLNVQETDLAGHAEDVYRYADRLQIADRYIGLLLERLNEDDLFIVTADHGNDPTIGHSQHTREKVPILVHKQGISKVRLGMLHTLADIAATASAYFEVEMPANGQSFLKNLESIKG